MRKLRLGSAEPTLPRQSGLRAQAPGHPAPPASVYISGVLGRAPAQSCLALDQVMLKTEPTSAVQFHLYEVFRTGKSAELESRLVLAGGPRGWGVVARGSTVPLGVIMVH